MSRRIIIFLLVALGQCHGVWGASKVSDYTRSKLQQELPILGLAAGDAVLLRTFKKESQLELWVQPAGTSQFVLFRTYPICFYSGDLGPKLRQGDKTTPEGFYNIATKDLHPESRFHLALDIGFPNAYDRDLGRTGSLIRIHGACDAVGCFAMGNDQMEEIYYLVEQALRNGQQSVPVHAFPFRLSLQNLSAYQDHKWYGFWVQLKAGYDAFNNSKMLPVIEVSDGRYVVTDSG